jgi:hypothetical protein
MLIAQTHQGFLLGRTSGCPHQDNILPVAKPPREFPKTHPLRLYRDDTTPRVEENLSAATHISAHVKTQVPFGEQRPVKLEGSLDLLGLLPAISPDVVPRDPYPFERVQTNQGSCDLPFQDHE